MSLTAYRTNSKHWVLVFFVWVGLPACHGGPVDPVQPVAPACIRPIPEACRQARLRLRAHDLQGALALLEVERPLQASEPERAWLVAHILAGAERGHEARRRVRAMPRGGFRTALLASLLEDLEQGRRWVSRGGEGGPDPWVRLAAAYLAEEAGASRAAGTWARSARGRGSLFVDVDAYLIEARASLELGQLERAVELAELARRLEGTDIRAHHILAAAARRDGDARRAVAALVETMRLVPGNRGYARRLAQLLRRFRDRGVAADAERQLAGVSMTTPEHRALEGLLAERGGRRSEAIQAYGEALQSGALPTPVDRDLRRLLAAEGRFGEAVDLLVGALPRSLRHAEENVLRGAWREVERTSDLARDRSASEPARVALARALVGVGALDEARSVLRGVASGADLDRRLAGQLAFEDAVEDALEGGYEQSHRKEAPPTFAGLLGTMTTLAGEHLAPEEVAAFRSPSTGRRQMPMMGTWLDHGAESRSPIVRHFRRYGRFLVLGQRTGQPPEAIAFSLGYLAPKKRVRTRGRCLVHDIAVGYDRRLSSWLDQTGAALAGACLPDGVWLDADAARLSEHELLRALDSDPGRFAFVRSAPRHVPPDGPGGLFGMGEGSGVASRLVARYLEGRSEGAWGSLDTLTVHELAHLVELKRHLPVMRGLPATIGLLASRGFDLHGVECELERRAQLGAIAESKHPDLALAEMVLSIPDRSRRPEVHAAGYEAAVTQIAIYVWQHPERFPQIDRRFRILPQLDLLTNDQIRAAAVDALGGD